MNPRLKLILSKSSPKAAPLLLGWILCRQFSEGLVKLKIVETEAYRQDDPASHSFKWRTKRTAPMFEAGGTIYVYFTYGMHYCMNIVTGEKGVGEGVLLRAAQPLESIDNIRHNRGIEDIHQLANGPGKLTMALGITDNTLSGQKLGPKTVWLEPPDTSLDSVQIAAGPRVGISQAKDKLWRFYIKDSPFVSRAR